MNLNLASLAWRNIRSRKTRSWLTILGMLIGVTAIVTLISVGTGVESAVLRQFEDIGLDVILLTPRVGLAPSDSDRSMLRSTDIGEDLGELDAPLDGKSIGSDLGAELAPPTDGLDIEDLLRGVPQITETGRVATRVLPVSAGNMGGFVRVLTPSRELMVRFSGLLGGLEIAEGRQLAESGRREVLLGAGAAEDMDVAIGETIQLGDTAFTVVGILATSDGSFEGMGGDLVVGESVEAIRALASTDDAVFVPLEDAVELWEEEAMSSLVAIRIRTGVSVTETILEINDVLARQGASMTPISTQALADNVQRTLGMVKTVLASIAAISLLVGTVGMMNTMYTAVLERIREIGILKSVGAKDRQVLGIFLIDSGLMGFAGGILGIAIGVGASFVGTLALGRLLGVTSFAPVFVPWLLLGVAALSFVLGSLAGAWPAWHASRIDPVEALRSQ